MDVVNVVCLFGDYFCATDEVFPGDNLDLLNKYFLNAMNF